MRSVLVLLLSAVVSEAIISNPASLSLSDMAACNMLHYSYVCDPTHMITPLERGFLHTELLSFKFRTRIPSVNVHDCDAHGVTPLVLLVGQTSDEETLNTLLAAQQWQLNHDLYSGHCRNYLVIVCGQRCLTASNSKHIPADAVDYILNKQLQYHKLSDALLFTLKTLHPGITYEAVLQPWTADKYPNPTVDPGACRITEKSTFCDPDAYFTREERAAFVDIIKTLGTNVLPAEHTNEATCAVLRTRIMVAVAYRLVDYSKKGLDEFANRTREAWAKSDPCADNALILIVPTATPSRFAFSQKDSIVNQAEAERQLNTRCNTADTGHTALCALNFTLKYFEAYSAVALKFLEEARKEGIKQKLSAKQQPAAVPPTNSHKGGAYAQLQRIDNPRIVPVPVATAAQKPGRLQPGMLAVPTGGYNDFDHHSKAVGKRCVPPGYGAQAAQPPNNRPPLPYTTTPHPLTTIPFLKPLCT